MSESRTRRFWRNFIELYKNSPALWNTKSEEYKNRKSKAKAFHKLLEKLKEFDVEADQNLLIRKLNALRANYKRELKVLLNCERSGEAFESSLWYFELLDFLRPIMKPPVQHRERSEDSSPEYNHSSNSRMEFPASTTNHVEKRKRKHNQIDADEQHSGDAQSKYNRFKFLEKAVQIMRGTQDEAEIYAQVWASEFRKLDDIQKLHAKRAIDEILYQGRFGNLLYESSHIKIADKDESMSSYIRVEDKEILEELDGAEEVNGVEYEEEDVIEFNDGKHIAMQDDNNKLQSGGGGGRQSQSAYRRI